MLIESRHAALIADRDRLEHVAVIVDRERQGVADTGIGRIALVVVVDSFIGVAEEYGVAIRPARLQAGHLVAGFGDAVGQ